MRAASNWILRLFPVLALALAVAGHAQAQITIDQTSVANHWVISNGALTVHFFTGDGRIDSIQWNAFPGVELIDQTNRDHNGAKGFYMDNAGLGFGTVAPNFFLDPNGNYIDFWMTHAANATNPVTYEQHDIMFLNDPGIHVYFTLDHGPGMAAASIGQIQWVFRGSLPQFVNTYDVNSGLGNLGARIVPESDVNFDGSAGRNVQDATSDLHGLSEPAGYRRQFNTKYDYSSYEYLHRGQGVFGGTMAAWMVLPSSESLTGGPTKQDLIFAGNLLIMEAYSNHLDNDITFPIAQDAVAHRLYGPFYLHFNAFNSACSLPSCLYQEARHSVQPFREMYDNDTVLLSAGYPPSSARGDVLLAVQGLDQDAWGDDRRREDGWGRGDEGERGDFGSELFDGDGKLLTAWAVLSDPNTNFQYSHAGWEYWQNLAPGGIAIFHGVAPGAYRLSVYALGKWGELREDNVTVNANQLTRAFVRFTPERFGHEPPIWTIGTADRSSHEFLHGTIVNPIDLDRNYHDLYTALLGDSVQDDREYWGNWNYWADFAANNGAVIYYATPVGSTPATNDLTQWNYNQWHHFDPGLYAGIYNPADQSTDGFDYICPAYVGTVLAPGSSDPCAKAGVPDWQVHFTTSSEQQAQGQYVVLSVGLAATESSLTVSLNGNPLSWSAIHLADADVRSGFSGTYQWVVLQFPTSLLNAPGADNVFTFHVSSTQGVEYDALRMEITNQSAAHESTGWNDYEFVTASNGAAVYEPANDAVNNQAAQIVSH